MEATDYGKIRLELGRIQEDTHRMLEKRLFLDFGLFLLIYLFSLVTLSTLLLAAGVAIGPYHCLIAVVPSWALLAWIKRAPFYALLIAVLGVAFIAACAYASSLFYDLEWDSNCYHKPDVGLLANGWNPFRASFMEYSNSSGVFPYKEGWRAHQVDTQPKASFLFGACFYALTGTVEAGKCFNLISIVSCICIGTPLLRRMAGLRAVPAFLCMVFAAINPITLVQCMTYYNDGLVYQVLTSCALSYAYLAAEPDGPYRRSCYAAGFLAICLAVNIKTSALIFAALIAITYYFARLISVRRQLGEDDVSIRRHRRRLTGYFALIVLVALFVVGSATYVVNWYRYGSPIYGMLEEDSINSMISGEMSKRVLSLPYFVQFFVSLFSPSANQVFAEVSMKLPFTVTSAEWLGVAAIDTRLGGWGVFFGGIFLVSLLIVIVSLFRLGKARSRYFMPLLLGTLLVLLPTLFVPYLWWARYYPQPFWISALALCCLFSQEKLTYRVGARATRILLGIALCGLLAANLVPQARQLKRDYDNTQTYGAQLDRAVVLNELYRSDVVLAYDEFYGLLLNLQDAGITDYQYVYALEDSDAMIFDQMGYQLRWRNSESPADVTGLFRELNNEDYLIVIAANGDATFTLSDEVISGMRSLGLSFQRADEFGFSYLAVVDGGTVVFEASGEDAIRFEEPLDGIAVSAVSSGGLKEPEKATIALNGLDYSKNKRGYNIVAYSRSEDRIVEIARIDSYWDNALTR